MEKAKEKSFDFANDTIKLLLTLATGVLAFNLTFIKDIIGTSPIHSKWILVVSWFILLFSIFCCLWTLFSITGSLDNYEKQKDTAEKDKISIYNANITIPSLLAIISFLTGVFFNILFSLKNF